MLTTPYCAEVLRSVEYRGLNLTHGGTIRLDVKRACKGEFGTLSLGESNNIFLAECEGQEE